MNAHRRQLYAEIERTLERGDRIKRVLLILGLAAVIAFMFTACAAP